MKKTFETAGDMRKLFISIMLWLPAIPAYAGHLFTEQNGNTFVWEYYEIEDGQYCTWLAAGKFCIPKESIASVKRVNKRDVETRKVADTKTKSYVPVYRERQSGGSTSGASSSASRGSAGVSRSS
jgi:hypothetical protein